MDPYLELAVRTYSPSYRLPGLARRLELAARELEVERTSRALQRAEELTRDVAAATESAGDATSAESNVDIAEDSNVGGRGHRASPEEAGGPSAAGKVKSRMD